MSDQYGGHYAPQQPQQYAVQPQYQQAQYQQQYDQYGDGYGYEQKPSARGRRKPAERDITTEGSTDGKSTTAAGILGAIGVLCALVEVIFCALSPLWFQDILCLLAICFGSYSFASSTARSDRWRAISSIAIGCCALIGTMSVHAMTAVVAALV